MTPTQRTAALRLAKQLEQHENWRVADARAFIAEAAALLRELAAEPVQDPVAWMAESKTGTVRFTNNSQAADELAQYGWAVTPLHTTPPQRQPLDYCRVQEIAQARRIGYNELSAALRDYLGIACIGRDPLCPCQDGDACHYKDTPTTKAWLVPGEVK